MRLSKVFYLLIVVRFSSLKQYTASETPFKDHCSSFNFMSEFGRCFFIDSRILQFEPDFESIKTIILSNKNLYTIYIY